VRLHQLSKIVLLSLCIGCNPTQKIVQQYLEQEYYASDLIDAERLAVVADSFQIPHYIFYAVAWQETRRGNSDHIFPRGPGRIVLDSLYKPHRVCREIGRVQMSPCVDWSKILKDPICINKNLLSDNKYFAYQVNLHCAAKHLASLHTMYNWMESVRHYNGDGPASYIYLNSVLAYIGRFYLKLQ